MPSDTSPRGRETITAFFDSRSEAETALDRLRAHGIAVEEARIYEGQPALSASPGEDRETRHKGFWETLGDLFLPTEDRGAYAEGLSRGGTLLSLPVRSADRSRILDILDDEGTIDLDARQESWRGEGWGGPATSPVFGDPSLTAPALGDTGQTAPAADATLRSGISGIGAHAAGAPPASFARRDESLGRRRARAYSWDEPVDSADPLGIEIDDARSRDPLADTDPKNRAGGEL